ncbi:MAG: hypothetical protein LM580_11970 [Thermofilum sp.]|nr:hypothetical protein [Thermofilum sp.]
MLSYELVRQALLRYERARVLRELGAEPVLYVTEVAGGSRGRGSGAEVGREVHREIWGLDPEAILSIEEVSLPLPLAWRFRFGWLLGVADLVTFRNALPVEVMEVKSYEAIKSYEAAQASLYGLLVALNFATRPRVYVVTPRGKVEVSDWESLALQALRSAAHPAAKHSLGRRA